jgi:hypothetical protein
MQLESRANQTALNIIGKFKNRYPNRLDIVYLLIQNEVYDTRSKDRREVYQSWLERHDAFGSLARQVLGK